MAGAAYRRERAVAVDASTVRLRLKRWRLGRRDDNVSRARLRAVCRELDWRAVPPGRSAAG